MDSYGYQGRCLREVAPKMQEQSCHCLRLVPLTPFCTTSRSQSGPGLIICYMSITPMELRLVRLVTFKKL